MNSRLRALRDRLRFPLYRLKPYRPDLVSGATWDREYRDGRWDFLRSSGEADRYAAIARLLKRHQPDGAILDVGCGEGVLRQHLAGAHAAYFGIDLSAESIRRARAAARFEIADATAFEPPRAFDAIVFNECLYYFEDPASVVGRYAHAHGTRWNLKVFKPWK